MRALKVFYYPTKFSCHRYCDSGDIINLVCHVISQNHVIKRLCGFLDRRPSIKVSYHPAKFGGLRHYGSKDLMVLFYDTISQDHVIKWSHDFIGKIPPR